MADVIAIDRKQLMNELLDVLGAGLKPEPNWFKISELADASGESEDRIRRQIYQKVKEGILESKRFGRFTYYRKIA